MLHYHGTPITPIEVLSQLKGRHFCVSHQRPEDVARCHAIGQGVMLDNGAFSAWKAGKPTNWTAFYSWVDPWIDFPNTWAVVPDVIDGGSQLQDALLREWPHGKERAAPVWHMDEPIHRLLRLIDEGWSRVCIGSTAEYAVVLSSAWTARMDELWDEIAKTFRRTPALHMLRGMQLSGMRWPFASVDSTDVARNHNRTKASASPLLDKPRGGSDARAMADRWDAMQCPPRWSPRSQQMELLP